MGIITEELVDAVYEAAAVPELWPSVLDRVASRIGSCGGVLFANNSQHSSWIGSSLCGDVFAEFVERGMASDNPRAIRAVARDHAGFVGDHELFTRDEMDREPAYAFMRSKGVGWCAGTVVRAPSDDVIVFSWERLFKDGPFSGKTIGELDPLRPHLARAALISGRLGLERARAAAETLGLIGLPAAVLSRSHRLLAANKLFEKLVPSVFHDRKERVCISERRGDALFVQALLQLNVQFGADQVRSIPLSATPDRPASVLHVVPVRGAAHDIFAAASCVLVITSVSRQEIAPTQVIQGLFDLTPAEARIARGIAAGRVVEDLAAEAGVSSGTVRHQLKSVFTKIGISRQAELVRMLAGTALP